MILEKRLEGLGEMVEVPTFKCWNSHVLMMVVAVLGKMPRLFFWRCLSPGLSSSSFVPSPEPILLSKPSPAEKQQSPN